MVTVKSCLNSGGKMYLINDIKVVLVIILVKIFFIIAKSWLKESFKFWWWRWIKNSSDVNSFLK